MCGLQFSMGIGLSPQDSLSLILPSFVFKGDPGVGVQGPPGPIGSPGLKVSLRIIAEGH